MMTRQEEDNGDYGRKWYDQQVVVQPDSLRWEAEMWRDVSFRNAVLVRVKVSLNSHLEYLGVRKMWSAV